MATNSTTPPELPLSEDIPCANCGYNLRTRLPSALCPECGHPVAPSIALFNASPIRNRHRACIAIAILLFWSLQWPLNSAVRPLLSASPYSHWIGILFTLWLLLVPPCTFAIGLLLLDASTSSPTFTSPKRRITWLGFFPLILLLIALFHSTIWLIQRLAFPALFTIIEAIALPSSLVNLATHLLAWRLLLRIHRPLGQRRLARYVSVLFAFDLSLEIIFLPYEGIRYTLWWKAFINEHYDAYTRVIYTISYTTLAYNLAFAIYWALLFRQIRRNLPLQSDLGAH